MRPSRSFLTMTAMAVTLAACGGFLGFGDEPEEPAPLSPAADSSVPEGSLDGDPDDGDPGTGPDATKDSGGDANFSDDATLDVKDTTNADGGPGVLVFAPFENNLIGGDGADIAPNMDRTKTGAIRGGQSAITLAGRPAVLGWAFGPLGHAYVSFSLKILTMPNGLGGEILRLTGAGGTVNLFVASDGTLVLRSNNNNVGGANKMQTNQPYRIGLEVDPAGAGTARSGLTDQGIPNLTESTPWAAGLMNTLEIRTADPDFSYLVDDVVVSDKGIQ